MWTIYSIVRTFRMFFDPLRFIGSMVQYNITNAERKNDNEIENEKKM